MDNTQPHHRCENCGTKSAVWDFKKSVQAIVIVVITQREREIGHALTVQCMHANVNLTSAFPKLGCSQRSKFFECLSLLILVRPGWLFNSQGQDCASSSECQAPKCVCYTHRTVSGTARGVTVFEQHFLVTDTINCLLPVVIYTRLSERKILSWIQNVTGDFNASCL